MWFLRLSRMLLGLALLAWIGTCAASKSTPIRSRFRRDATASDSTTSAASTDFEHTVSTTSPGVYCPAVNGLSWTLFGEKCYYRYYAPLGVNGSSWEELEKHYKTWFEAREECSKLGAKLASVHDRENHEALLKLIAGNETVTYLAETTWIGLQVGSAYNVTLRTPGGDVVGVEYHTGSYWPAGVRPRLPKDDPCPANAVDECSVTYDDTFPGQWEDGEAYIETESADVWGPDEPSDVENPDCDGKHGMKVNEQNRAFCERGPNGQPDRLQHCAQILPAEEKQIEQKPMKSLAGKWSAYWCWMKNRGYICERPARRVDGPEDGTATTFEVEMQTAATTVPCAPETTTQLDDCVNGTQERTVKIKLEINITMTGYDAVIATMPLGYGDAEIPWLGGPAPFANLAQSAIDFGCNVGKLCAEACMPDSQVLQQQLHDLSLKMKESHTKIETYLTGYGDLWYKLDIRNPLLSIYATAANTLRHDEGTWAWLPKNCKSKGSPEDIMMLVKYVLDSYSREHLPMARVDTLARVALMSVGICAQSRNISESELNKSSKKVIQALSKVNDAFTRALREGTSSSWIMPTSTSGPPSLYVEDVVAVINETVKDVLSRAKSELDAKGWSGREELHETLVNNTVGRLNNYTSNYVFNALAYLPYNRDDQQCRPLRENYAVDVGYGNLNFFVLFSDRSSQQRANRTWEKMKDAKDAVLRRVHAQSDENLCGRLTAVLSENGISGFLRFAAVKCGYEFVWYELGYIYFYAAYSSTGYKWEKKGGAYDFNCGQIFFFP